VLVYSLEDVLMEESRLYLIFEFLSMDLKKYLDTLGPNKMMDADLVRSYLYQVNFQDFSKKNEPAVFM
jgi:cyclin-dependent kinase 1